MIGPGLLSLYPSFKHVTPQVGVGPHLSPTAGLGVACSPHRPFGFVTGTGGAAGGGGERPPEAAAGEGDH